LGIVGHALAYLTNLFFSRFSNGAAASLVGWGSIFIANFVYLRLLYGLSVFFLDE